MEQKMDISIFLNGIKINIRAAVLIETENGYIFERDNSGKYYWPIGGRIKINESSEAAAKREVKEELGIDVEDLKLKAIMESFFEFEGEKYHEIGFYYYCRIKEKITLTENYFTEEEMKKINIQPQKVFEIIGSEKNEILHILDDRRKFI